MSRRSIERWLCGLIALGPSVLCGAAPPVPGPDAPAPSAEPQSPPEDALETFLSSRGLDALLETYLLDRAARAPSGERRERLNRLGRLYAQRLGATLEANERERLMHAATELLSQAEADEALELRVALAMARYKPAEGIAERVRLLLADGPEQERAAQTLEEVAGALSVLGEQLHREVLYQQRRQAAASVRNPGQTIPELAEATRARSLAKYYAAWSWLYLGQLRGDAGPAQDALEHFAWVLDTPEEAPSLDRLPRSLLRLDHVARSAIGVAMALSLQGDHGEALAWMDAIAVATEGDAAIAGQLFVRRLPVLAQAGLWNELKAAVDERRGPDDRPLGVLEARLVVVLAMERLGQGGLPEPSRTAARDAAATALGDLLRQAEVDQVLDLARRFDKLPIEGLGFVPRLVQGSQLYESARNSHAASPDPDHTPTTSASIRGLYRTAADRLREAVRSPDASTYPAQRARAAYLAGLSLYYAGDGSEAVAALVRAEAEGPDEASRERALWMAIVASDLLSGEAAQARRVELSRRYLGAHPRGARAAAILLRLLSADLVTEPEAIEILRSVPAGDAIAPAARRQLAALLYRRVRRESEPQRSALAREFLALASELSREDASAGVHDEDAAVLRSRQVLDVALLLEPPDLAAAHGALRSVVSAGVAGLNREVRDELTLRRLQIAVAEGRAGDAEALLGGMEDPSGASAVAGRAVLLKRAVDSWAAAPTAAGARDVVRAGQRLLDAPGDPQREAAADHVARAAEWLWLHAADADARDLAIRIDSEGIDAGRITLERLRRLATLAEPAGRPELATRAWLLTMAAVQQGTEPWFEARYHSIRTMMMHQPEHAAQAFAQFRVLYPSLGPAPWPERFSALAREAGMEVAP